MKKLRVQVIGCENGTMHGKIGEVLGVEIEDSQTYVNVYFKKEGLRKYFSPKELKELK